MPKEKGILRENKSFDYILSEKLMVLYKQQSKTNKKVYRL